MTLRLSGIDVCMTQVRWWNFVSATISSPYYIIKVKNTSFDDRKLDLIEVASLGAFYSCEQCATMMSIFSFGDKKLAALRLMAPRIVDPHRAYIIFDQLSFQSEKDEAARIIGGCRR